MCLTAERLLLFSEFFSYCPWYLAGTVLGKQHPLEETVRCFRWGSNKSFPELYAARFSGAQPALGVECSRFVYMLLTLTTVENKAAWRWEVAQ